MYGANGYRESSFSSMRPAMVNRTYQTPLYASSSSQIRCAPAPSIACARAQERIERRDLAAAKAAARRDVAILALFLLLALAAVVVVLGPVSASASYDAVGSSEVERVVVREGDTLWSISQHHPLEGMSTRDGARWIMERNDLSSPLLSPGQVIEVPRTSA